MSDFIRCDARHPQTDEQCVSTMNHDPIDSGQNDRLQEPGVFDHVSSVVNSRSYSFQNLVGWNDLPDLQERRAFRRTMNAVLEELRWIRKRMGPMP